MVSTKARRQPSTPIDKGTRGVSPGRALTSAMSAKVVRRLSSR
jgi:hypothetical protein